MTLHGLSGVASLWPAIGQWINLGGPGNVCLSIPWGGIPCNPDPQFPRWSYTLTPATSASFQTGLGTTHRMSQATQRHVPTWVNFHISRVNDPRVASVPTAIILHGDSSFVAGSLPKLMFPKLRSMIVWVPFLSPGSERHSVRVTGGSTLRKFSSFPIRLLWNETHRLGARSSF